MSNSISSFLQCQSYEGKKGEEYRWRNHWGLAVLDSNSATLRFYDSSHALRNLEHIIADFLLLVNTFRSQNVINQAEWPMQWKCCREVYSVQQDNGYYCGMLVMMNAFYVSLGIFERTLIADDNASDKYRPNLSLCLLESDNSFVV